MNAHVRLTAAQFFHRHAEHGIVTRRRLPFDREVYDELYCDGCGRSHVVLGREPGAPDARPT